MKLGFLGTRGAVVVTHAHPDHVGGLEKEVDCPVYATGDTWQKIPDRQIAQPKKVVEGRSFHIGKIELEAFAVEHSIRAPAVGFQYGKTKGQIHN